MRLVTKTDPETNETLVWCGAEDFNPIQMQKRLRSAGLTMLEVREDRWAVAVSFFALKPEDIEEKPNG